LGSIDLKDDYRLILDTGCGTGRALAWLASRARSRVEFVGIDPAENMRNLALRRVRPFRNVQIRDGSFRAHSLEAASVDYLFSIFAFHWTTDPDAAVREVRRVLKPEAEMDLFFIGRDNGREFIKKHPYLPEIHGSGLAPGIRTDAKATHQRGSHQLFAKAFSPIFLPQGVVHTAL